MQPYTFCSSHRQIEEKEACKEVVATLQMHYECNSYHTQYCMFQC